MRSRLQSRLHWRTHSRLHGRRAVFATLAVFILIVGAVACSAAPGTTSNDSRGAPQTTSSSAPAKPAEAARPAPTAAAARPAPTSVPKSAPARPAEAARPADASAGRAASEAEARTAPAAGAPAAPGAQAQQPARPAPPAPITPPAPTPTDPADPAAVMTAQIGRMVIYTTEMSMLVVSPTELVNALSDIAIQSGGYVAGVESKDDGGVPVTVVRLKLPPDRYDATMRQIRNLAVEVTAEKATTQDVTEEFNDVQTQLASLEASHARLLELVSKAQNVEEILKIQEKIAQTKIQIDRLKGRETFLQRSAEFATVTITARPAEDILARTFSTLRTTLRRTEAQRTQTVNAIQRAKTPEEEATLRDRLAEITLEIERLTARLADVQAKAQAANITLPQPPQEDATLAAMTDQEMLKEYLRLVVELRQAEATRDRLSKELSQNATVENVLLMQDALVRIQTLDSQKKAIEERARRENVTLPPLTAAQITALAGLPPEPTTPEAGPVALVVLGVLVLGGLVVLAASRLRRRPPTAPHASAA